jgi:hypothetical protein
MTDPTNQAPPPAAAPAPAAAPPPAPPAQAAPPASATATAPSAVNSFMASMSQAELMMGGGALVILLADLVFGVFGDYGFSAVIWGSAAVVVIAVAMRRLFKWGFGTGYETILVVATLLAVLATIRNLILDVLFVPGRNLDITYFLGALTLYVGVALMAVGAWRMLRAVR